MCFEQLSLQHFPHGEGSRRSPLRFFHFHFSPAVLVEIDHRRFSQSGKDHEKIPYRLLVFHEMIGVAVIGIGSAVPPAQPFLRIHFLFAAAALLIPDRGETEPGSAQPAVLRETVVRLSDEFLFRNGKLILRRGRKRKQLIDHITEDAKGHGFRHQHFPPYRRVLRSRKFHTELPRRGIPLVGSGPLKYTHLLFPLSKRKIPKIRKDLRYRITIYTVARHPMKTGSALVVSEQIPSLSKRG